MKNHEVAAVGTEIVHGLEHGFRLLVEIGDQNENAPPIERLGDLEHRSSELPGTAGLDLVDRMKHDIEMLGRRWHEVDDVIIEGDHTDPVPLLPREVGQAGSEIAGVVKFADSVARVSHRARDIEDDTEVGVGVGLELLHIEPIRTTEEPPIDTPDIVARHVGTVFCEVE